MISIVVTEQDFAAGKRAGQGKCAVELAAIRQYEAEDVSVGWDTVAILMRGTWRRYCVHPVDKKALHALISANDEGESCPFELPRSFMFEPLGSYSEK